MNEIHSQKKSWLWIGLLKKSFLIFFFSNPNSKFCQFSFACFNVHAFIFFQGETPYAVNAIQSISYTGYFHLRGSWNWTETKQTTQGELPRPSTSEVLEYRIKTKPILDIFLKVGLFVYLLCGPYQKPSFNMC